MTQVGSLPTAEAAGLEVGGGPAHESDFLAEEAVERMMVPVQGIRTGWYFRQVKSEDNMPREAGGPGGKTWSKKLAQEVPQQSL